MAIDFELSDGSQIAQAHFHTVALEQMRPISRKYDLAEHQLPTEWVDYWWQEGRKGPKDRVQQDDRRIRHDLPAGRGALLGRCRSLSSHADAGARRLGRQLGGHRRTEEAVHVGVPRRGRTSDLGRHGDHRAPGRFGRGRDRDHRRIRPRHRRVDPERNEDLLHRRRGRVHRRRWIRRRLGDHRQERRPRRDQVLRRDGEHARHGADRLREEARHPRFRHRDAALRELPRAQRRTCSAARK